MPEDVERIRRELEEAKETVRIKDQRITDLNKETQDLRGKLDTLQRERPKLKPENLISSFKTALEKMQEGLKIGEGRVDYIISRFDTDLKVNVTLDEQGNINFQLPKLEDIIPPDNLSTLRLSIKPVPKAPAPPPDTVEVPNLIGTPKDAALESIEKANLKAGQITERASSTAPGTVIEQDPVPYSRTLSGSPIDLIISRVREVKVPNVIGMDKDNATDTIVTSKLTIGKIAEEVSDSPPGTVISQSITASTLVPVESSIDLVIAKEQVKVPNVIGMDRDNATDTIVTSKLTVGKITEEKSDSPAGTVISQSITADTLVPVGTSIDLLIAKPETVRAPDVIGKRIRDAKRVIVRAKLEVGKITEEPSGEPRDTVIKQSPEAGKDVPVGTPMDLMIARPEVVTVPNVTGMPRELAARTLESAKLRVGRIMEKPGREPPGTVIQQEPEAEEKVQLNTSVDITLSRPEMEYIKAEDVPEEQAKRILDFLNSAKTVEEVADAVEFPGERDVGVKTAQQILAARDKLGRFTDLKQVESVRQVGPERFTEIVKALG